MKHLFFILLLSCCIGCWAAQEITIIPKPLRLTVEQGKFLLRPQTVISYEKELYPQASILARGHRRIYRLGLEIAGRYC